MHDYTRSKLNYFRAQSLKLELFTLCFRGGSKSRYLYIANNSSIIFELQANVLV